MSASTAAPPPACAAYCSSHSRKAAFSVLCCDRATSRACSIRFSSALRVTFFIRLQCTLFSCRRQCQFPGFCLQSSLVDLPARPSIQQGKSIKKSNVPRACRPQICRLASGDASAILVSSARRASFMDFFVYLRALVVPASAFITRTVSSLPAQLSAEEENVARTP
jgi:hypothetical protein